MPYSRDRDPSNPREFYDAITPRPITGIQEAVNEMAAIGILADRLAGMRDSVARMASSQESMVTALNAHILHCSRTHGPLEPRLSAMEHEQAIERKERLRMLRTIERLQRDQTNGAVEELQAQVAKLAQWKEQRLTELAEDKGERRVYGRLLPIVGTLAGGGAAMAQAWEWLGRTIGP